MSSSDTSLEIELEQKKGAPASQLRENFKSLAAGGVGGVCAVVTGHPFDLVKVRCQSNQAKTAMEAVKKIVTDARAMPGLHSANLVRGFYKGVIPPLLGVTPIFAVSFWGYDVGKKLVTYNSDAPDAPLTINQMAAAGFISAIPTTLVTAPTERVKVVLQTSSDSSFVAAARQIVKQQGVASLFKGSLATLSRDGPGSALYFASYEVCKDYLNKASNNNCLLYTSRCV